MKLFRLTLTVMFASLLVSSLDAQTYQGRILGSVTDSSGAVVSGAKVTVTNISTAIKRSLVTNGAGEYVAVDLDPGSYKVTVEAAGFKKSESTAVTLEVARDIRVNLRLEPGAVTETVEVTSEQTLVDVTDSTLNGVLENKAINELPLQGRDFQNLLPLHPGVQRTPGGGFQSITSNGNRPDDNNFFIDGATDNDVYYGESVINEAGIAGTPASFLPLDAIQEFNTQESPSAEFGFKPGVVMNLGLKSGTNDLHGTAYYFSRNSAVDARNFFDIKPSPVSALIMHQFGVSLGGPIQKNKWFYFVNYEGIRDKVGNPGVYDSPVTASLANQMGGIADANGDPLSATYSLADAIAYCQQQIAGPCTPNGLSLKLSKLFLPNPGFTLKQSDPAAINFDFNNTNRGDNLILKTDYHLSDHHVLSARFFYSNSDLVEADGIYLRPEWLSTTKPTTQVFGVNWVWTPSSTWVNEARFSYDSFNEALFPLDHNVNPISDGINTGVTNPTLFGFPRINPGTDAFDHMGGNSGWPLETTPSKTFSWSDTVSYTAGRHNLQFGGEFRYGDVNYFRATEGRGRVDFNDLTDFIAGDAHRWELLYGDPKRDVSMKSFGLFLQDGFRATPRVTLNFGLRWDVTYPIKDSRNLLANYVPTLSNGQPGGIVQVGDGISAPYNTSYNGVSPRFGLAWDIFGKGKTIIRAGGGIIFEQPSIRTFLFSGGGLNLNPTAGSLGVTPGNGTINAFLQSSRDVSLINWSDNGKPVFPGESGSGSSCNIDTQCFVFAVNPHLSTPYVENWNFNIQQALPGDSMLQLAYVGNHGVNLYSITDPNQVNPNSPLENPLTGCDFCESVGRPLNSNCSVAQGGLGTGGACFPYIGFMQLLSNRANSIYHSLQVTFTKRYGHGLYLLAGYTYAHAIDTSTSNTAGVPQNSLDYNAERGNSDFDIRNRFTLSLAYDLPSRKAPWQLLQGWQVASIVTLEGGEPYTLGDFSDDISLTGEFEDRWNISGPAGNIHWSPTTPLPYIDPTQFTADPGTGNVTGGSTAGAQKCFNAAMAAGGQAAANQLNGNTPFTNLAGFTSTDGGCYVSGNTVLTPPAPTTFGNMGRNMFRGPSFREWDFSIAKMWTLGERFKMQLRGEFFNILNHPNFDVFSMNTDLSEPAAVGTAIFTPDLGVASNPVLGTGGSRHIQLGAKLIW